MDNKIIESLNAISDEGMEYTMSKEYKKRQSNSFNELSDWNSKNRYKFNRSINLPKIP